MGKKTVLMILCSFLLVNMFYFNTAAASSSYLVSGKITDSNLRPINGTKIVFEMEGGLKSVQIANTNNRGNFAIYLPSKSKTYWVTIGKEKYKTYRGKVHLKDDADNSIFNFILNK